MDKEFMSKIYIESEYYDIVKNTIIRAVDNISIHDLEDCISDVYEVALRKKNLEKHPNIHGWLNKTAKLVAMQHLRKCVFHRMTVSMNDVDPGKLPSTIADLKDDQHYNELLMILAKRLKISENKLFKLKFIENCSNNELAELLRIKPRSVSKRISRLREKIKNILREP